MELKSLTYTSLASLDFDSAQLLDLHRVARDLNALDGITGMLVFNGMRFLQIIEGSAKAIDDLLARLRRDPRHSGLEVRDERFVEERSFPGWSMELVHVESPYFSACATIENRIPSSVDPAVRDHILRMTTMISGTIRL